MTDLERLKLDALKELAYGASHEINNPLANIAARAQTLLRDETHAERRRALEAIHEQAIRAHEMISDLMLFARPPQLVLAPVNLNELVNQLVGSLSLQYTDRQIELVVVPSNEEIQIEADTEQLLVALKAVCANAIEAIVRDGKITVTIRCDADRAIIEVADTGPGIAEGVREHIFDPFYSGREVGRGLGFGLSKCWRIITEHGGDIEVSSEQSRGAMFTICLPFSQSRHQT